MVNLLCIVADVFIWNGDTVLEHRCANTHAWNGSNTTALTVGAALIVDGEIKSRAITPKRLHKC